MDLSRIESKLTADTPDLRATLGRLKEKLDGAIGVERRMVERLRPGLLVHIGLFAALRWCVEDLRARTGHECRLCVPSEELALSLSQRVSLYRVALDALSLHESRGEYPQELAVELRGNTLHAEVTYRGHGSELEPQAGLRLLDIRYRVGAMNGELVMPPDDGGPLRLIIRVPSQEEGLGEHRL
jgi:signal transduction histidine kinase